MPFFDRGGVRIRYEEAGTGYPLLVIPGGGLNSSLENLTTTSPFNPLTELSNDFRVIAADLRNAVTGQSTGPFEIDRPWDGHTDDQLGLMDHLGLDKFMVLGFCIGGPFIWNILKRASDRVTAAVVAQSVGFRPEKPDVHHEHSLRVWAPEFMRRRPDVTLEMIGQHLDKMYRRNPDFVFTASRDFARACATPMLVLPDDVPSHPLAVALDMVKLVPKAEVSMYPWKEPKSRIPLAVAHLRSFLLAHRPQ